MTNINKKNFPEYSIGRVLVDSSTADYANRILIWDIDLRRQSLLRELNSPDNLIWTYTQEDIDNIIIDKDWILLKKQGMFISLDDEWPLTFKEASKRGLVDSIVFDSILEIFRWSLYHKNTHDWRLEKDILLRIFKDVLKMKWPYWTSNLWIQGHNTAKTFQMVPKDSSFHDLEMDRLLPYRNICFIEWE